MASRVWLCMCACLLLTAATPSAAERDTARALMDDGDHLLADGKLPEALDRYRAAHAIMHVPSTGIDLARVEARLGLLVEARATAMEVVNMPEADTEPEVFQQARGTAVQLVRELEPRVPSLRVEVTPEHSRYQLQIDGMSVPAEARAAPFRTNPGSHSVHAEAPGYVAAQREVVLAEGQTLTVSLELARVELPEQLPKSPDAALRRDDVRDARAAGKARGYVGLGIGAAGVIAGSVTGLIAFMKTDQERKLCLDNHCDVARAAALRSANTFASMSNVSFALGGLGVAYGLFELLTLPSLDVEVGAGDVTLRGTF